MVIPSLEWELKYGFPAHPVAGVDEVGRGCLAGPVVAGAVILPALDFSQLNEGSYSWINDIRDSKLLSHEKREELAPKIKNWVDSFAIGVATVEEIDQLNIHHAVHLAMRRAILGLSESPKHVLPKHILIDGKFVPKDLPCPATAIVKGDQKSLTIACASVIAKVWRDHLMADLEHAHPGYGLSVHKGYPTPAHKAALVRQGVTPIHRRSFGPVRDLLRPQ